MACRLAVDWESELSDVVAVRFLHHPGNRCPRLKPERVAELY